MLSHSDCSNLDSSSHARTSPLRLVSRHQRLRLDLRLPHHCPEDCLMAGIERIHESAEVLPSSTEIRRRAADGWKLVALVWQREVGAEGKPQPIEEIPY